jgi:hypothetical protein
MTMVSLSHEEEIIALQSLVHFTVSAKFSGQCFEHVFHLVQLMENVIVLKNLGPYLLPTYVAFALWVLMRQIAVCLHFMSRCEITLSNDACVGSVVVGRYIDRCAWVARCCEEFS